jgi:trigger factor
MDYEIKKLPKSELEIKITIADEEIKKHRGKAIEELSKDLKVKGFRPGHIPEHVLEQYIDKAHIEAKTQDYAIQMAYADIVIKEKLQVIARPEVKIEKEKPLTITAKVTTLPEPEIKDHQSIKVPKKEVKVDKKDIDEVIDSMKKHGMNYKEVDRKSKKGDRVEVDFAGFDEKGKELEGTKSKNHPLILGEKNMIPGFEEEMIGLKKGEKKEFDIPFPKDYHKKDFQDKKVKFKIEIQKVEEAETPELDDALVEKMTGKKMSVKEYKAELEKNILAKKEQEAKQERENTYIEELLKKTKLEVPDALIDEETHYILEDMKNDIAGKGLNFEDFLNHTKTTEEKLKEKYRSEAEKRVKMRLVLRKLLDLEKIEVKDPEVKTELEHVKSFYPKEQQAKIEEDFKKGELKNQIINRLALRKLFEKVLK